MVSPMPNNDTIAAIATANGRGGVGIIRVSGKHTQRIATQILGELPTPRHAHFTTFKDGENTVIDEGIALFFQGPHSFTGEDVLELQGHGGPVLLDLVLQAVLACGARLANPGEFSQRAFLNDKLDLAQAEAIADMINATSEQAARSAVRSLQGAFSKRVHALVDGLIKLRVYVEAAIDFPEEEIDFLSDGHVAHQLINLKDELADLTQAASQGALLRDGMSVVIAGKPNAGKSSLLNALAGKDSAIVTDIAGTTRDVLREHIHIDGMPLHLVDTAGLRDAPDEVEQIGIARARDEIQQADGVLLITDASTTPTQDAQELWPTLLGDLPIPNNLLLVRNKIDKTGEPSGVHVIGSNKHINVAIKDELGLEAIKHELKQMVGYQGVSTEGNFIARRRHLDALKRTEHALEQGQAQLHGAAAGELLAEDLRAAQQALSEITGTFSADDLLGEIFGSFCIGK